MKKILFIVGPTATGKTGLGLELARLLGGEIISADSRQVYEGMTIGTGKDIPKGFEFRISNLGFDRKHIGFYTNNKLKLWGYDLVEPGEDFSVAQFSKIVWEIIGYIWRQDKLPIVIGGTGFYVQSLVSPPSTMGVGIDRDLRIQIDKMSVDSLKKRLKDLDKKKFESMNNSDRNNPRRLIRAIEIVASQETRNKKQETRNFDQFWVGLKMPISKLDERIDERVKKRIEEGFEEEFESLVKGVYLKPGTQAGDTLGYKQWWEYEEGKVNKSKALENWVRAESQYARRQMTWFKKRSQIEWFEVEEEKYRETIVKRVKSWYSK